MHSLPPANLNVQLLQVEQDSVGQRIDNYLIKCLKGAPKTLIYRIVRKGEVRVNKGRVKPDYKLQTGDRIRIPPVRLSTTATPGKPGDNLVELLNDAIVYEDDTLLAINKPSGLAVHGGSGVKLGLIESLRQIRPRDNFLELVHRLDRDTSGCVMIAKNRRCLRHLQNQLRTGGIEKIYRALVFGHWPKRRQAVNAALLKKQAANGERTVRVVDQSTDGAKAAQTHYKVITCYNTCTLIEARPVTGRTHQIRVHCRYAGHGILGDDKYGHPEQDGLLRTIHLKRLFLHAYQLRFTHLDGEKVHIQAPLSDHLQAVLDQLERGRQLNRWLPGKNRVINF